jgi:hypothetical protein
MSLPKAYRNFLKRLLLLGLIYNLHTSTADALTANKVWFEFHETFYRVYFQYTMPELREMREAYIEFTSKKKAEIFYSKLLHGADFELGSNGEVVFLPTPTKPDPW